MDADRQPFRQVGTHRRFRVEHVAELRKFEDRRRAYAAELSADTEDLEANYAPGNGPA
jgi:hypothetical protein